MHKALETGQLVLYAFVATSSSAEAWILVQNRRHFIECDNDVLFLEILDTKPHEIACFPFVL